jgi:type I restriction enzyme S subunit
MSQSKKITPVLRFPEFRDSGGWNIEPLGVLTKEIIEKTRGRKYKLMSITSGIGLVSQVEKFGREIAGNSYNNYYVIHKGDFAYNKSSTKLYPEGEIVPLETENQAAIPNSIFVCFRFNEHQVRSNFAKYLFVNNLHGNWLRRFIAVGARANGALQVNSKDLFSVLFPFPQLLEQQKIAACLSSLDGLIAARGQRLALLQAHKKGLMQRLFPQAGERVPRLRFPEFRDSGEWEERKLGDKEVSCFVNQKISISKLKLDNYVSTENMLPDFSGITLSSKLPATGSFTQFHAGDILVSNIRPYLKKIWKATMNGGVSNDVLVFRAGTKTTSAFLEFNLKNDAFIAHTIKSSKGVKMPRGDKSAMQEYLLMLPTLPEQQKIAACLSALDGLIAAEAASLAQLKLHKKGLMQGLFPQAGG